MATWEPKSKHTLIMCVCLSSIKMFMWEEGNALNRTHWKSNCGILHSLEICTSCIYKEVSYLKLSCNICHCWVGIKIGTKATLVIMTVFLICNHGPHILNNRTLFITVVFQKIKTQTNSLLKNHWVFC